VTDKHVVVVGAGPVGMLSALKLSKAGIPVTVIEKVKELKAKFHVTG
jgi:2-polyprenyl-6-methoxyphenol hydroxylase-like FAD-dependent oxidoreductase